MYRVGVLTAEDAKAAYQDIGFDEAKAEKMTAFTIGYETRAKLGKEIDAAKDEVLRSLREKEITREQALAFLQDLDFDEYEAGFLVQLAVTSTDFKSLRQVTKRYREAIQKKRVAERKLTRVKRAGRKRD